MDQQIEFTAVSEIGPFLDELSAKRLLLVVDRQAFNASGIGRQLKPFLQQRHVIEFDDFVENPRLEDICLGIEAFRTAHANAILAIGGGTALDVAKLIRCFADQDADPNTIIEDQSQIKSDRSCPLIAIPTTAGTGSEATHFAVVYVDGVKHSIADESILPSASVVDPKLTSSMPPHLTAATGLDAMCQAIESMWSVNSTPQSRRFAHESLGLAVANLHAAVHSPTPSIRAAMSRAANLSGKAINVSKTTAPHACSYAITINHGVPHGHAVALTLGSFLAFNQQVSERDIVDSRGVQYVHDVLEQIVQTLGCHRVHEAQTRITSLMDSIGCPTRLRDVGVTTESQIELLVRSVNLARLANNPRSVTDVDLRRILESIR